MGNNYFVNYPYYYNQQVQPPQQPQPNPKPPKRSSHGFLGFLLLVVIVSGGLFFLKDTSMLKAFMGGEITSVDEYVSGLDEVRIGEDIHLEAKQDLYIWSEDVNLSIELLAEEPIVGESVSDLVEEVEVLVEEVVVEEVVVVGQELGAGIERLTAKVPDEVVTEVVEDVLVEEEEEEEEEEDDEGDYYVYSAPSNNVSYNLASDDEVSVVEEVVEVSVEEEVVEEEVELSVEEEVVEEEEEASVELEVEEVSVSVERVAAVEDDNDATDPETQAWIDEQRIIKDQERIAAAEEALAQGALEAQEAADLIAEHEALACSDPDIFTITNRDLSSSWIIGSSLYLHDVLYGNDGVHGYRISSINLGLSDPSFDNIIADYQEYGQLGELEEDSDTSFEIEILDSSSEYLIVDRTVTFREPDLSESTEVGQYLIDLSEGELVRFEIPSLPAERILSSSDLAFIFYDGDRSSSDPVTAYLISINLSDLLTYVDSDAAEAKLEDVYGLESDEVLSLSELAGFERFIYLSDLLSESDSDALDLSHEIFTSTYSKSFSKDLVATIDASLEDISATLEHIYGDDYLVSWVSENTIGATAAAELLIFDSSGDSELVLVDASYDPNSNSVQIPNISGDENYIIFSEFIVDGASGDVYIYDLGTSLWGLFAEEVLTANESLLPLMVSLNSVFEIVDKEIKAFNLIEDSQRQFYLGEEEGLTSINSLGSGGGYLHWYEDYDDGSKELMVCSVDTIDLGLVADLDAEIAVNLNFDDSFMVSIFGGGLGDLPDDALLVKAGETVVIKGVTAATDSFVHIRPGDETRRMQWDLDMVN
jgi:hypothetical protein